MFRINRSDDSKVTSWYFEIDRRLLLCVLILMFLSVLFSLSAGSVAAERIGQSWHFFMVKAIPFYITGLIFLFGASFLNKKQVLTLHMSYHTDYCLLFEVLYCLFFLNCLAFIPGFNDVSNTFLSSLTNVGSLYLLLSDCELNNSDINIF